MSSILIQTHRKKRHNTLIQPSWAIAKKFSIGKIHHANGQFRDALGNMDGAMVAINADGCGELTVSGGSVSVWIQA